MSEPVIHLFYGIPLSLGEVGQKSSRSALITKLIEDSPEGVYSFYSSNSYFSSPAAFGILVHTVAAGDHHTELNGIDYSTDFNKLFQALPPKIQSELLKYGEPRDFILWTTA